MSARKQGFDREAHFLITVSTTKCKPFQAFQFPLELPCPARYLFATIMTVVFGRVFAPWISMT
jgi:hypothetical protein